MTLSNILNKLIAIKLRLQQPIPDTILKDLFWFGVFLNGITLLLTNLLNRNIFWPTYVLQLASWLLIGTVIVLQTTHLDSLKEKLKTEAQSDLTNRNRILIVSILVVFMLIGGWLRLSNLGNISFHHDEFFHVSVAQGYLSTNEFRVWDYVNEIPLQPYTRSWIYTWLVALSMSIFGINETAARLPGAIIDIASICLIFWLAYRLTNHKIALIASAIYTFYDPAIYLARFVRSYSFLTFFTIVYLIIFHYLVTLWSNFAFTKKKIIALLVCLISLATSAMAMMHFSELGFNIILGSSIFFVILVVTQYFITKKHSKDQSILLLLLICIGIISIILVQFKFLPISSIGYALSKHVSLNLDQPQTIYLAYLFQYFYNYSPFVILLVLLGTIFSIFKLRLRNGGYLIVNLLSSIFASLFLWSRYEDFRYIQFLQPLAIIMVATGFYCFVLLAQNLIDEVSPSRIIRRSLSVAIFALIFAFTIKLSLPSTNLKPITHAAQLDWKTDEGARIHRRAVAPKYREVYQYLNENAHEQDIVITTSGESWHLSYLPNPNRFQLFSIPRWDETFTKLNGSEKQTTVPASNILNEDKIKWVILDYPHLLNYRVIENIDHDCQNISNEIPGNFIYNYNDNYANRFYWPSVYRCDDVTYDHTLNPPTTTE